MNIMKRDFTNVRISRVHVWMLAIPAFIIGWNITRYYLHKGQRVVTTEILYDTPKKPDVEMKYSRQAKQPLMPKILVKEEMNRLNEKMVEQDDPRLIKIIRDHYILQPTKEPYNLRNPNKKEYSEHGKEFLVPNTIKDLPNKGFFIECGAYDGELRSSTLFFEREKHWNGLLIEANPSLFKLLRKKNRKAYLLNACLNTKPYPSIMKFNQDEGIGRLVEGTFKEAYRHHQGFKLVEDVIEVQCFPLYSVLLALNQTNVDYMGLDVEGVELSILKTVPWAKVNITTMLVEYSHSGNGLTPTTDFLERKGYTKLKVVGGDILVHKK